MIKKIYIGYFLLLFAKPGEAQNTENLHLYYPDKTIWPLEINVVVHVMQYSADDPRNYTPSDTADIYKLFATVNQIYNNLEEPTLKVQDVRSFPASKIEFVIQKVLFHVDSLAWKVDWFEPDGAQSITSVNKAERTLSVKGKFKYLFNKKEGIHLVYANGKYRKLDVDTTYEQNGVTWVTTVQYFDTTGLRKAAYPKVHNENCADDNFRKYGSSNAEVLHVFLTQGTISHLIFGCGPNKNYLNLSNTWKGNYWVAAQLMAHEVGHCIGLSHTNYPQFPDMPKTDKFGWIACDTLEVSNNIMGYNICRSYLSPMQIAYVHRSYNTRLDYIKLTRNKLYKPGRLFEVSANQKLERNLVINGDILIRHKKRLTISGIVYITPQTRIFMEEGSELIVDGGSISVLDNAKNSNIVYCKRYKSKRKYKKKGVIKTTNNGKIVGLSIN